MWLGPSQKRDKAYQVLSDETTRAKYDVGGAAGPANIGSHLIL